MVFGISFPTLSGIDIGLQRKILFVQVTRCRNHAFCASPRGLSLLMERFQTNVREDWKLAHSGWETIDGSAILSTNRHSHNCCERNFSQRRKLSDSWDGPFTTIFCAPHTTCCASCCHIPRVKETLVSSMWSFRKRRNTVVAKLWNWTLRNLVSCSAPCPPRAHSSGAIRLHIPCVSETPRPPIRRIGRSIYQCEGKLEAETYCSGTNWSISDLHDPLFFPTSLKLGLRSRFLCDPPSHSSHFENAAISG